MSRSQRTGDFGTSNSVICQDVLLPDSQYSLERLEDRSLHLHGRTKFGNEEETLAPIPNANRHIMKPGILEQTMVFLRDENGNFPRPAMNYPAPETLSQKWIDHFVRCHKFIINNHIQPTTAQRRSFERDVYDFCRILELDKKSAELQRRRARAAALRSRGVAVTECLDDSDTESCLGIEVECAPRVITAPSTVLSSPAAQDNKRKRDEEAGIAIAPRAAKKPRVKKPKTNAAHTKVDASARVAQSRLADCTNAKSAKNAAQNRSTVIDGSKVTHRATKESREKGAAIPTVRVTSQSQKSDKGAAKTKLPTRREKRRAEARSKSVMQSEPKNKIIDGVHATSEAQTTAEAQNEQRNVAEYPDKSGSELMTSSIDTVNIELVDLRKPKKKKRKRVKKDFAVEDDARGLDFEESVHATQRLSISGQASPARHDEDINLDHKNITRASTDPADVNQFNNGEVAVKERAAAPPNITEDSSRNLPSKREASRSLEAETENSAQTKRKKEAANTPPNTADVKRSAMAASSTKKAKRQKRSKVDTADQADAQHKLSSKENHS